MVGTGGMVAKLMILWCPLSRMRGETERSAKECAAQRHRPLPVRSSAKIASQANKLHLREDFTHEDYVQVRSLA